MDYSFKISGHENILANHKTTLEFAKDKEVDKRGDCVVGVNADFSLEEIKRFIKRLNNKKFKIIIFFNDKKEEINAEINPDFNSDDEIVIRKTEFVSGRTLAISADKSASDLDRELVELMQGKKEFLVKLIG